MPVSGNKNAKHSLAVKPFRRFDLLFSRLFSFVILSGFCATPTMADMVYKPISPSFGGDPFNSSHLQSLAGIENQFKPKEKSATAQSESERFIDMLQSRLYSSLASQVADAIFGENAQKSGTITFDDQQISFNNTGTSIELMITDLNTGQVTTIVVPTLVAN